MGTITLCNSTDLPEQGRLVVDAGTRTIGVFRLDGLVYAYLNVCPHQGGPVCQGAILPRVVENMNESHASTGFEFHISDRHIVCPWHGYEFDIRTGRHAGCSWMRLTSIAVEEADGEIIVHIP